MSKIAALFSTQKESGQAISALAQADLGDLKTRVIEDIEDGKPRPLDKPLAGMDPLVGLTPTIVVEGIEQNLINDLNLDEEEARFLLQGVRHGGTLLLLEVDEENEAKVQEVLETHQGKIFKE